MSQKNYKTTHFSKKNVFPTKSFVGFSEYSCENLPRSSNEERIIDWLNVGKLQMKQIIRKKNFFPIVFFRTRWILFWQCCQIFPNEFFAVFPMVRRAIKCILLHHSPFLKIFFWRSIFKFRQPCFIFPIKSQKILLKVWKEAKNEIIHKNLFFPDNLSLDTLNAVLKTPRKFSSRSPKNLNQSPKNSSKSFFHKRFPSKCLCGHVKCTFGSPTSVILSKVQSCFGQSTKKIVKLCLFRKFNFPKSVLPATLNAILKNLTENFAGNPKASRKPKKVRKLPNFRSFFWWKRLFGFSECSFDNPPAIFQWRDRKQLAQCRKLVNETD